MANYGSGFWYYGDWHADPEPAIAFETRCHAQFWWGLTVPELQKKIADIQAGLRIEGDDRLLAHRRKRMGLALIAVAKNLIAQKQGKPARMEIDPVEIRPPDKPKIRVKMQPAPSQASIPLDKAAEDQTNRMWAFNERSIRQAHDASVSALQAIMGNDPDFQRIKDLETSTAVQDLELNKLLSRAQGGDGYATNTDILERLKQLMSDGRELVRLRDHVQGEYGVGVGDDGNAASIGSTITRSIEVVEDRLVGRMGQTYGTEGRQPLRPPGQVPRRNPADVKRDLISLLTLEKQRQLFGGENGGLLVRINKICIKVLEDQRADFPIQLAEILRQKEAITKPDETDKLRQKLDQLALEITENERTRELLGTPGEPPWDLYNQIRAAKSELLSKK